MERAHRGGIALEPSHAVHDEVTLAAGAPDRHGRRRTAPPARPPRRADPIADRRRRARPICTRWKGRTGRSLGRRVHDQGQDTVPRARTEPRRAARPGTRGRSCTGGDRRPPGAAIRRASRRRPRRRAAATSGARTPCSSTVSYGGRVTTTPSEEVGERPTRSGHGAVDGRQMGAGGAQQPEPVLDGTRHRALVRDHPAAPRLQLHRREQTPDRAGRALQRRTPSRRRSTPERRCGAGPPLLPIAGAGGPRARTGSRATPGRRCLPRGRDGRR